MIEIQQLSKSYGAKPVLRDVSLTLAKGRVYGIVGPNGAGKTTFFRCIAGLESHEGTITSSFLPLKDHLGFLFTDPYFLSKMTGQEYLQLLCNARRLPATDLNAKNIFDLPLNQYAETYSTGMKKKLALTGILLQNNDFYILDEPYNGVDIQSNMIITEIIHKLKSLQKTVLISSHIYSTLKDTCDEIHLLSDGEIIRKADKHDFESLEQEMMDFTIGDVVNRLGLE